jgi:hypothetical protein
MNLNYWHAQFESSTPTRANMVNSVQMQHVTNEEEVLSDTFACLGPPLPLGEKCRGLCYTILPMWRRAISVLLLLLATTLLAQDVTLAVVLARLHQHLRDYADLLPATVAVEPYQQRFGNIERVLLEI